MVGDRPATGHFTIGPGHEVLTLKADQMIDRGAISRDANRMTRLKAVNWNTRVPACVVFTCLKRQEDFRSVARLRDLDRLKNLPAVEEFRPARGSFTGMPIAIEA
jgi:hypothetical protein